MFEDFAIFTGLKISLPKSSVLVRIGLMDVFIVKWRLGIAIDFLPILYLGLPLTTRTTT